VQPGLSLVVVVIIRYQNFQFRFFEMGSVGNDDAQSTSRREKKHSKRDEYEKDGERSKRMRSSSRSKKKQSSRSRDRERSKRDKKYRHKGKSRERKKRRYSESSSSDESSSGSESSASSHRKKSKKASSTKKVVNTRLLEKLSARGETLAEREERRSRSRAERVASKFGYTAEENPFNDANLYEPFSWGKKEAKDASSAALKDADSGAAAGAQSSRKEATDRIISEIEKVRQRRLDREDQFEEMERLKAEESRLREMENYDEWQAKEEQFHLQQQRQRSAIRLVEGREKPIDVLAKNLLLFGLTDKEREDRSRVRYQERYNALNEVANLEAELCEPHVFLHDLKLAEMEDLMCDINAFRMLEREVAEANARENPDSVSSHESNIVRRYWDNLHLVCENEIEIVKTADKGGNSTVVEDINKLFEDQSPEALNVMKDDIINKMRSASTNDSSNTHGVVDTDYWQIVLSQLNVHQAKEELSELHSQMLVQQLEKLEKRKDELSKVESNVENANHIDGQDSLKNTKTDDDTGNQSALSAARVPVGVAHDFGNLEESLGFSSEVALNVTNYLWQDKYRPRKPRYFNRVKTGYDWNKYNQTHYDHDNPPPKTVQGYKFNIFYPDLIDKTTSPQYFLEPADSNEFCILRFRSGPPYEDIAFKIINREWNRSRKRGFRCTFERGVLSLYFNFSSHWYRR